MDPRFLRHWSEKVKNVRSSDFWQQVSDPPTGDIDLSPEKLASGEITISKDWTLIEKGNFGNISPARAGI